MLTLLYFYMHQKRMDLNTEKAFWRAFCVTFACICFDILSVFSIWYIDRLPEPLVAFICKTYLASLLGVALSAVLYVCVDVYKKKVQYQNESLKYTLLTFAGIILVYILPLDYHYSEDGNTVLYTEGPSVFATYLLAVGLLIVVFFLIYKERGHINPKRREAVRAWVLVWTIASLVQFFHNELLIVGFACSIGIMILYLKLENPETNLDRQTGLFNHNALVQYTRQLCNEGISFSILSIVFERSFHKNISTSQESSKMEIVEYLLKLPDAYVFKNIEDEILLLFKDREIAEKYLPRLAVRFEEGWGRNRDIFVRPSYVYLPDSTIVDNADDILYLLHHVRQDNWELSEEHFCIADKKSASKMYKERETELLITNAIEKDWVEVYYQPIYSTKEHRFTSAEALVRIKDANGNIVPPGVFIDVAEKNGMILSLGEMVFEKVCKLIKNASLEQYGLHYIEVNLSVVQCAYEKLAEDYIKIMEQHQVSPGFINLEITESASMEAKKTLLDNMVSLLNYGVHFSLDDFGTGQSNLNYIVDMPVDIVKFDKSMTNAYFENGKAKYVMDAAIHMIHGMSLSIVSEGIETKEQYQTMEELGVSYIQGYYFSKPLPEKEFIEFLAGHLQEEPVT